MNKQHNRKLYNIMQPTLARYSTKTLNLKGNFLSFLTDTEKKLLRLTLGRLLLLQKTYSIPRSFFFFFFFFSYQVCIAMRQVEEGSEEIEKQPRLTTKKTVSRDCTRKKRALDTTNKGLIYSSNGKCKETKL